MSRIRVHELADQLQVDPQQIIGQLLDQGLKVRGPSTVLAESTAARVRRQFRDGSRFAVSPGAEEPDPGPAQPASGSDLRPADQRGPDHQAPQPARDPQRSGAFAGPGRTDPAPLFGFGSVSAPTTGGVPMFSASNPIGSYPIGSDPKRPDPSAPVPTGPVPSESGPSRTSATAPAAPAAARPWIPAPRLPENGKTRPVTPRGGADVGRDEPEPDHDPEWRRRGLDSGDQEAWQRAGLRGTESGLADQCRAADIEAPDLGLRLSGRTVLQRLRDGESVTSIWARLQEARQQQPRTGTRLSGRFQQHR